MILSLVRKCVVYQFHNTSMTARLRGKWDGDDSRWLKEDGANLGPFLLRLRDEEPGYFHRIVETTRLVLPFFADYELGRDGFGKVLLQWRERGSDVVFSAAQASDGMLRAMALLALLLQPEKDLPGVPILDEPELGLHPHAIGVVASLLRRASVHCQVLAASHDNPESIDLEDPPSKRILQQIPDYDKVSGGILAIEAIGLKRIRLACPHFNQWLTRLETLSA